MRVIRRRKSISLQKLSLAEARKLGNIIGTSVKTQAFQLLILANPASVVKSKMTLKGKNIDYKIHSRTCVQIRSFQIVSSICNHLIELQEIHPLFPLIRSKTRTHFISRGPDCNSIISFHSRNNYHVLDPSHFWH